MLQVSIISYMEILFDMSALYYKRVCETNSARNPFFIFLLYILRWGSLCFMFWGSGHILHAVHFPSSFFLLWSVLFFHKKT